IVFDTHQDPTALEAIALQCEFQTAALESFFRRLIALGGPVTAVPQLYRAAAVLAFGDRALEISVVQRVVFYFDRQALVRGIQGRTSGHRPGFEYATELKSEVVVQPARRVLLNDVAQLPGGGDRASTARLRGLVEIPLGAVSGQLPVGLGHDTL